MVVLLSKLKYADSIEVEIKLDEEDLTKSEGKATYSEIKEYVKKNTGLKVSSLNIAQTKRKHDLIERENYNLGDGKSQVPEITKIKEEAIENAFRFYKMI